MLRKPTKSSKVMELFDCKNINVLRHGIYLNKNIETGT